MATAARITTGHLRALLASGESHHLHVPTGLNRLAALSGQGPTPVLETLQDSIDIVTTAIITMAVETSPERDGNQRCYDYRKAM